ncbi:MAG: hypothetical protein ACEQR8_06615 [Cypionkella sp.]
MATKEDILEQVVEEYLTHLGYFVQHNVKFLPRRDHPDFISNQDSNHSDIDVLAYHPTKLGADKVIAVSCKSWQQGFNPSSELAAILGDKVVRGRKAWKSFRELTQPKWSEAYIKAIEQATGSTSFTYVTAVSKIRGDRAAWEGHAPFSAALNGNPIRLLTFKEMVLEIQKSLTYTLAATEVGRLLQMFRAAGVHVEPD